MKNVVVEFLKKNNVNNKSCKFLLSVSGGVDSMCLAESFRLTGLKFSISHCNFNLRGEESIKDSLFVKDFCVKNNIEFFIKNFSTKSFSSKNKISIQMAARELRYKWLENIREKNKFNFIVLGHHLDDSIETHLINFIKGTGFRGLHGIKALNNYLLRPFINISKKELLKFAEKNNIEYREDSSNYLDVYYRNKVRNKVIPMIMELNPNFKKTISNNIKWISEYEEIVLNHINNERKKIFKEQDDKTIVLIKDLNNYIDSDTYIYEFFKYYGFTNNNEMLKLALSKTGKKIFSKSHIILKNRDELIITKNVLRLKDSISILKSTKKIEFLDKVLEFRKTNNIIIGKDINIATIDYEKLIFPLEFRVWKSGDYFFPFGMDGKKKISDYLIDNKVSLIDKKRVCVLISNKEVVWLAGYRIDNRYKVEQNTKKVYIAELN